MKFIQQSVFFKITACILQQLFFAVISITIFMGVIYWNYDNASFHLFKENNFTKTSHYKGLMEGEIYQLMVYIDYCEKFQTKGTTDLSRIVDIYDYVGNNRITGTQTISVGYTIQDLLDWYTEGFIYIVPEGSQTSSFPESSSRPDEELLETCPNSTGQSLAAFVKYDPEAYLLLCEAIEEAAEKLYNEYEDYRTSGSFFLSGSTNLRYCIRNIDSGVLYTNMPVDSIEEGEKIVTTLGSYVFLNADTGEFGSNIFYSTDPLNHTLNTLSSNGKNYDFVAGVDTDFPILDNFHKENLQYNSYYRWFQLLYKSMFFSIAGYLICFFYLSAACGHKKGQESIALNTFDRLKTEGLLLLFLFGTGFLCRQLQKFIKNSSQLSMNPRTLLSLTLFSLFASLFLSLCYYSFLRRLKASVLWKQSLLHLLLSFLRKLFRHRSLAFKACTLYTLYILFLFFIVYATSKYLLLLLMPAAALILGFFLLRDKIEKQKLQDGCRKIAEGNLDFQIDTGSLHSENRILGETINQISRVLHEAVEDSLKNERLKTSLITNVSHDIKTPLTSIINYVSLLKNIPLENEQAVDYIQILEDKSQRLKHLTEDLVEASKLSSGNIHLELTQINLVEMIKQVSGEFFEKFQSQNLSLLTALPEEPIYIQADGRRLWRILENLYNNACKYSLSGSRVYASLETTESETIFSLKNVSSQPLVTDAENLTQRFVRGDESRNTEGSGLGLSIAQDLCKLHGGQMDVFTDGDLFTAQVKLPLQQGLTEEL